MHVKSVRLWMFCLLMVALAVLTAAAVLADNYLDPTRFDGRINRSAWLDNNAVYCIDQNGDPTSDGWSTGGIRVLDGGGQPVLFASAADINAVGVPSVNTPIVSVTQLILFRQPDGQFSLNGIDSGGTPYAFVFPNCVPIDDMPVISGGGKRRQVTPEPTQVPPPPEVGFAPPTIEQEPGDLVPPSFNPGF